MCTITWVPKSGNEFIIGVNRDESPVRKAARSPLISTQGGVKVLAPVDGEAGGTWVAVSGNGRFMALMNGAFAPHKRRPPYLKSRGLVVQENFLYPSAVQFVRDSELAGIEPFTAILADTLPELHLFDLRWDGCKKYFNELRSDQPHIWSSENLFTDETHHKRELWFDEWCKKTDIPGSNKLEDFHINGGKTQGASPRELLCMSVNNKVRTISTTIIHMKSNHWEMSYRDLLNAHDSRKSKVLRIQTD